MIDAVITRLKDRVPDLGGRIEGAAELAALTRSGSYPHSLGALVVPAGLRGGAANIGAGLFQQDFAEAVSVVLVVQATDRTGVRALKNLRPLIMAVAEAIAGWAPDDTVGVFELTDGRTASFLDGRLVYQINFTINDELRITP